MDELTERLRRFIRRQVASREDAEDVIQDAYVRLLRYSAKQTVENPERLLFSTARNLAIDSRRRRQSRERTAAGYALLEACEADLPGADELVDALQRLKTVEAAVARLPRRCREIFVMHRIEGMSYSEIAKRCGISVSAVEKNMARACLQIDARVHREDDDR
jgi:RNA polymerase sigma factor (sigma-70 family)